MMEGSGSGSKTYGSYESGSRSTTLLRLDFFVEFLKAHFRIQQFRIIHYQGTIEAKQGCCSREF
jgi:hypothetical protein